MTESTHGIEIRPLAAADLEAVIALDERLVGRSRRGYFERRLASALRDPKSHLQIAAARGGELVGFTLGRVTSGEYGRTAPTLLLETIGVAPSAQHLGVGRRMLAALSKRGAALEVSTLVTLVDWRNHAMLRFLDAAGFSLAPRLLLERAVARMPLAKSDEDLEKWPALVRRLRETDFEGVVRVDRKITGRDRSDYFRRKFDEALHESAMQVSLVVEDHGFVAGFAMARVDLGDFGHVEPTAWLDTLGVDPDLTKKGFARDMLCQLVDNLAAIHVERLETEVAFDHFELARFFHAFDFAPSQRLVLQTIDGRQVAR